MTRKNVKEQIILTDTVLLSKWVGSMTDRPQGWFTTFADLGGASSLNFYNVRNNSVGIMWNNQDARDQLPYGMRVMSIGVKFFSPTCSGTFTSCTQNATNGWDPKEEDDYTDPAAADLLNREELHSALWEADLPNHASLVLKTNQDIRLKGPCSMFPGGYGPVGGGWAWGSPGDWGNADFGEGVAEILCGDYVSGHEVIEHGEHDLRQRFPFPVNLEIPKRANLVVEISFARYARDLLGAIPGPYWHQHPYRITPGAGVVEKRAKAALFGIQVTIAGERLIQQRGDYSV